MLHRFSILSRRFQFTAVNLGMEMKTLNDSRQFEKVLTLHEQQLKKETNQNDSLVANQVLKACIELNEIERGKRIHANLSRAMSNNLYIQTNLIRLYSEQSLYSLSRLCLLILH